MQSAMQASTPKESMKIEALISEFVGTFFLVLTIGYNVLQGTALAPISIGSMLMAMIFATGKVSGGHFNPAVTLGVYMRGWEDMDLWKVTAYACSQILGGVVAGCVYGHNLNATFTLGPGIGYSLGSALLVELLFTTVLVFVVLSVATTVQDYGNWYGGLAIGFTVMAAAFAIGPISGCSLNPAVTCGVMFSHLFHTGHFMLSRFLIYTIAQLLGAVLAVFLFTTVRNAEMQYYVTLSGSPTCDLEALEPRMFQTVQYVKRDPITGSIVQQ